MSNLYNQSFDLINSMRGGHAAGHYYNDSAKNVHDYADGWYLRRAKLNHNDLREMLIDMTMRKKRLEGQHDIECTMHRPLQTGLNQTPDIQKIPHIDYKHKKGKYEYLYRKQF